MGGGNTLSDSLLFNLVRETTGMSTLLRLCICIPLLQPCKQYQLADPLAAARQITGMSTLLRLYICLDTLGSIV